MKPTLYITAGHQILNGQGTGARSGNWDEAVEARKLVTALAKYLWSYYKIMTITDVDKASLKSVIAWLKRRVKSNDIVIDVHFNAASFNASGTSVFIPNEFSLVENEMAEELVNTMASSLEIRNRGVKTEKDSYHKRLGMLRGPHVATNILLEVCFLTNKDDMKAYTDNFNSLVVGLGQVIRKWYEKH